MYERNAIVLERYFNQMFGYNMKNNIKTNFKDYSELIECFEKYKNISEEEETIMQEYDSIANKIRDIQKKEEILNKKNNKYQEEREQIFQTIDERPENVQKKLDNINQNIENINEEIKENARKFVELILEFNEKTQTRTNCERARRKIENEYNHKLNETLDNYKDIELKFHKIAKTFIDTEDDNIQQDLIEKIQKNGAQEKIPFNTNVISKAITLTIYIQKREVEILINIYEKTNKLFLEIKNGTIKNDKHKKNIKDSTCKLEFIGAIKEYLVQFLDNERLTAVNGEEEHSMLMKEACDNLEEDLEQINNLYTLLLKEISKKITKKSYAELYNINYLNNLEKKSKEFDDEIRKLNLPVTIINPNYWRIEGMKKIYDVFYKCVTEDYNRDLSEFVPIETADIEQNEKKEVEQDFNKRKIQDKKEYTDNIVEDKIDDTKTEIDKKIDMILGFSDEENFTKEALENSKNEKVNSEDEIEEETIFEEDDEWNDEEEDDEWNDEEDDDDWEDEEEEDDEWNDEEDDDDWEDEEEDDDDWEDEEEDDDDWEDEEEDDEWEDEDDEDNEEKKLNKDLKDDNDDENFQDEVNDILNSKNNYNEEDNWENQFIRMNKKNNKKKKGFFNKFKK